MLGAFAQGLAGGLALLAFFQTYLLAAAVGQGAFLAFYSPLAQQVCAHACKLDKSALNRLIGARACQGF